jgi:hypothetical protein
MVRSSSLVGGPSEGIVSGRVKRGSSDCVDRGVYGGAVLESYSSHARHVVLLAEGEARRLHHGRIGTEHLLLGLLADADAGSGDRLRTAGASLAAARHKVTEAVAADPDGSLADELPFTPRARRALERAGRFSRQDRQPEVTADHVLLGVLDVEGLACQVLRGLGVDIGGLRSAIAPKPAEVVEEPDAPEPTEPAADEQSPAGGTGPICPWCREPLAGGVSLTSVAARGEDGTTATVDVIACATCGASLGVVPHGRAARPR